MFNFFQYIIFEKKDLECALEFDKACKKAYPLYKRSRLRMRILKFVFENLNEKKDKYLVEYFTPIKKELETLPENKLAKDFMRQRIIINDKCE